MKKVVIFLALMLFILANSYAHDEDPFICPGDLPSHEGVLNCEIEDECAEDLDSIAFNDKIQFCPCNHDVPIDENDCDFIRVKVCNADCPLNTCCTDCWIAGEFPARTTRWNYDEQRWVYHSRHQIAIGQLPGLKESEWVTIFIQFVDTSSNESEWSEHSCDYHVPVFLCCWEDGVEVPCYEGHTSCFP